MNEIDLNDDDVISMDAQSSFIGINLSRFSQIRKGLGQVLGGSVGKWLVEGVKCEVLRADTPGWVKGKIRIRFEFIPDEPADDPVPDEDQAGA